MQKEREFDRVGRWKFEDDGENEREVSFTGDREPLEDTLENAEGKPRTVPNTFYEN